MKSTIRAVIIALALCNTYLSSALASTISQQSILRTISAEDILQTWRTTKYNESNIQRIVSIKNAKIIGDIDLQNCDIPVTFYFENCIIQDSLLLVNAHIGSIVLSNTTCRNFIATQLRADNSIIFKNNVTILGRVSLSGAKIGGSVNFDDTTFSNEEGFAIDAERIAVDGSVFMRNIKSANEIRFLGANIKGVLEMDRSVLHTKDKKTLNAEGSTVAGNVSFSDKFKSYGTISLQNAQIGGNLSCDSSTFRNKNATTLLAEGISIKGGCYLRYKFQSFGTINLNNSKIGGNLELCGGEFQNGENNNAISASKSTIAGGVLLTKTSFKNKDYYFKSKGEVKFIDASVDGYFNADGGIFENSNAYSINLERATINRSCFFRDGFKSLGTIDLISSKIGGALEFDGGTFSDGKNNIPINLSSAMINGSLSFSQTTSGDKKIQFQSLGEVRLNDLAAKSSLIVDGGKFVNPKGIAFNAQRMHLQGSCSFKNNFSSFGTISFKGATIGSDLSFTGGKISDGQIDIAINAANSAIGGDLSFSNETHNGNDLALESNGEVKLSDATIKGNLVSNSGLFNNPNKCTIEAQRIVINGSLLLRNEFISNGTVDIYSAHIGSSLDFGGAKINNPSDCSLNATSIKAKSIYLDNDFISSGSVSFDNALIDGDFDCTSAKITSESRNALTLQRTTITGDLTLAGYFENCNVIDPFVAKGIVDMSNSRIGGDITFSGGHFYGYGKCSLYAKSVEAAGDVYTNKSFFNSCIDFTHSDIKRSFHYTNIVLPKRVHLILNNAKFGVLDDDKHSWPDYGNLDINGLTYLNINNEHDTTANDRINWIQRQYAQNSSDTNNTIFLKYNAQPYEQLATYYKNNGYENEYKKVEIAKNEDLLLSGRLKGTTYIKHLVYKHLTNYGYTSALCFFLISVFLAFGTIVFVLGFRFNIIVSTHSDTLPASKLSIIQGFIYSVDTFIPLVHVFIQNYRISELQTPKALFVKIYLITHVVAGWVLTTFVVAGMTGLLRH